VLLVEVLLLVRVRVRGSRWAETRATTAGLGAGLAAVVSWPAARICIVAMVPKLPLLQMQGEVYFGASDASPFHPLC